MATVFWTNGAADGDASNTANYSGGALPSDGDSLIIDTGYIDITTGLSALNAINLADFFITETFFGSIGSQSGGLTVGVSGLLKYNGRGSFAKIGGGTNPIAKAKILGGNFFASSGTYTTIELGRTGDFLAEGATVVTNISGAGMGATLLYNATGMTLVEWQAGNLVTERSFATARAHAASRITTQKAAAVTTALYLDGRAMLNHQSSGTITFMDLGVDSIADSAGAKRPFTVTNCNVRPGSKLFVESAVTVTYSNPPVSIGF